MAEKDLSTVAVYIGTNNTNSMSP
jgi:hypothetical protein